MPREKLYNKVNPPFTLDKRLDSSSKEAPSGYFHTLKNYIPDKDILRTREGITVFAHTPDVTAVTANDFSGDANALSWYKMSYFTGNSIIDEISGNHISAASSSNLSRDTSNRTAPGLSASISLDNSGAPGSNAYFKLNYANFVQKFPGHCAEATTYSVCFWFRLTQTAPRFEGMVSMWHADSAARSWYIGVVSPNTTSVRHAMQRTAAGSYTIITSNLTLTLNTWFHYLATFNSSTKTMSLRIIDSSGASHYSASLSTTDDLIGFNQGFSVGALNNTDTAAVTGQMQELVIFNDIVSEAEQDQIRQGLYSP